MISYADLQVAYNRLYTEVRKYLWDFPAVAALADLEIAIYKTCQDLDDIRNKFYRLKSFLFEVFYTDEELQQAADYLESLILENNVYVKLNQVNEVIQDEDI